MNKQSVLLAALSLAALVPSYAQTMDRPTYKVGDAWVYINENALTHLRSADSKFRIAEARPDGYRVIGGTQTAPNITWDIDGATLAVDKGNVIAYEKPEMQWPLAVGRKWQTVSTVKRVDGITASRKYDVQVETYEDVQTSAGTFKAFKVKTTGWHQFDKSDANGNNRGYTDRTDWWSPEVGRPVKTELRDGGPQDRTIRTLQSFTRN